MLLIVICAFCSNAWGQTQTIYVRTSTITSGNKYLIVNSNTAGSGYALGYEANPYSVSHENIIQSDAVTINAGTAFSENKPYINSSDVDSKSIWTVESSGNLGYYKIQNGSVKLDYNNYYGGLNVKNNNACVWAWEGSNNRLKAVVYVTSSPTYYYVYYNNNFVASTTVNSVYLYEQRTITTYTINVSANPESGGTVSGGGSYSSGASCTVTATANAGYNFVNWTEGGSVVSTSASYMFTVTRSRNLVANFVYCGAPILLGSGTTTNSFLPSYSYNKYSVSQQIYTKCEIGTAGNINSISFYNAGTARSRIYDIYLVETDKTEFTSTTDWVAVTAADKVYSGASAVSMVSGNWTTFNLDVPFSYSGTRNLVVVVDDNTGENPGSMSCRTYSTGSLNQALRIANNTTDYNPVGLASTGTRMTSKNQVQFGICGQFSPSPVSISVSASAGGSASVVGGFSHAICSEATVTATPNSGYVFAYWTEGERVVSTSASYTFTVTSACNLVANFARDCSIVEVLGKSTSTNSYLPSSYSAYSLSQQIYTPCEIGKSGEINSISFYNSGTNTTYRKFDIYLVHTDKTSFINTSDWIPDVTAADKVFSGFDMPMRNGEWTTFYFDTPFQYDGVHNLAVIMDNNRGSSSYSTTFSTYTADGYQALYINGTNNYDPTNISGLGTGSRTQSKNKVKFGICDQQTLVVPTITEIAGNSHICHGSEATLGVEASNVGASPTYAWSNDAGSTALVTVHPENSTTYTVTVTADETACSATASVGVTVKPQLTLSSSLNPAETCLTGTTPVTLTASDVAGLISYSFTTGVDASKWYRVNNTENLITSDGDGKASVVQTMPDGFTFQFGGTNYTQFSVNSDGNLRFGGTVTGTGYYSSPFSSSFANQNNPKINGMGFDGYFDNTNYGNYVYMQIFGDAPNRVLVVEFKESPYNINYRQYPWNWQVQLSENGTVQIVYADADSFDNYIISSQIGLCVNASDGWTINTTYHTAMHFTNGTSTTNAAANLWPGANRYYCFTPVSFDWANTGTSGTENTTTCVNDTYTVTPTVGTNTYTVTTPVTGCQQSISFNVVNRENLDVSDATVTCGNPVTLTASGIDGATYNWYSNEACTASVDFPIAELTNDATYYVQVSKNFMGASDEINTVERTFTYIDDMQAVPIPYGTVSVKMEVWGAQGGDGYYGADRGNFGKGGYSTGTWYAYAPEEFLSGTLYVYVGGQGVTRNQGCDGGYNGGGASCNYNTTYTGGSGGGATHIATVTGELKELTDYQRSNNVLVVAGGGGGGAYNPGGHGGGTSGTKGGSDSGYGGAGSSSAGGLAGDNGSFDGKAGGKGQGGRGYRTCSNSDYKEYIAGGGGGGWYGGGGGGGNYGGGGGSGYVKSTLIDRQTVNGASLMPKHDGSGTMTGNTGDGYARITFNVRQNITCTSESKAVDVTVTPASPTEISDGDMVWRGGTNSTETEWDTPNHWFVYNSGSQRYSVASLSDMPATAKNYYIGIDNCLSYSSWPSLNVDAATVDSITIGPVSGASLEIPANKTLNIAGSVTGTLTARDNSSIVFNGGKVQTLSAEASFSNVTFDQSDPGYKINASNGIIVRNSATFNNGIVNGDMTFNAGATAENVTDSASFVAGKVTKYVDLLADPAEDFTFPTGSATEGQLKVLGSIYVPEFSTNEVSVTFHQKSIQIDDEGAGFSESELPRWWNVADNCRENNPQFNHVSNFEYWKVDGIEGNTTLNSITLKVDAGVATAHFHQGTSMIEENINAAAHYDCWKNLGGSAEITNNGKTITVRGVSLKGTRSAFDGIVTLGSKDAETLLPIELLSFSAECNGNFAKINWSTATERNNDYFILERSDDAINFVEIGRVAGAGNSIEQLDYTYNDYGVHGGDNYYRLWQVDYDGTRTASEIIVANCIEPKVGEPDVLAYPNPFNGELTIVLDNFENRPASIEVYDVFGKLIFADRVDSPRNSYQKVLNLNNLPSAAYNIRVSTVDFVINKNVVKQ